LKSKLAEESEGRNRENEEWNEKYARLEEETSEIR